ncbi:MAG: hypothetical protein E6J73_20710 [Deltaproteobacteria bacterium]|nr:MAG: hypothetical protein E6J73_20710 [Deltaproteobacteria bacterium]
MASKADFTPEEWKTIVAAAPMVGLAVTCASPNGPWGVMKEMLSMGMAMAEMLQKGSSNPLIAELAADLKARQTKPEPPQGLKDPEQCKQSALNHVRAVNDLLNRKVKAEEADEFKKWLLTIGRRVAEASNEGGVFGFGGERVSEAEKNVLRQIAFALEQPAS